MGAIYRVTVTAYDTDIKSEPVSVVVTSDIPDDSGKEDNSGGNTPPVNPPDDGKADNNSGGDGGGGNGDNSGGDIGSVNSGLVGNWESMGPRSFMTSFSISFKANGTGVITSSYQEDINPEDMPESLRISWTGTLNFTWGIKSETGKYGDKEEVLTLAAADGSKVTVLYEHGIDGLISANSVSVMGAQGTGPTGPQIAKLFSSDVIVIRKKK
jgi:hypothetical protein